MATCRNLILLSIIFFMVLIFGCAQSVTPKAFYNLSNGSNPQKAVVTAPQLDITSIRFENTASDNITNKTTYITDKFSINYPNSWQNIKIAKDSIFFVLAAPFENKSDQLRESINLGVDPLHDGESVPEYADRAVAKIEQQNNFTGLRASHVKIGNSSFYRVVYPPGKFKGLDVIYEQTFVGKDNTVYVFTYLAESRSFQAYSNTTNAIIGSFVPK